MDASIEGKTDEGIGIKVFDNSGVEHRIEMYLHGEIVYHSVDEIPADPSERTTTEDERFTQARRYAQYYVAQETEHDTLPWDLSPDRFEDVRQALMALSSDEIEELFGDLLARV